MEVVLPLRHRTKASNLLDMTTTKLPVLWIKDFIYHMRSQKSIEEATYLWEELYKMQIDILTDLDRQFLVVLQDIVMEWIIDHHYINTLVDFYFYNYILLHLKCIPYSTWTEEDQTNIIRYLEENVITHKIPILEQMNLQIRQLCQTTPI